MLQGRSSLRTGSCALRVQGLWFWPQTSKVEEAAIRSVADCDPSNKRLKSVAAITHTCLTLFETGKGSGMEPSSTVCAIIPLWKDLTILTTRPPKMGCQVFLYGSQTLTAKCERPLSDLQTRCRDSGCARNTFSGAVPLLLDIVQQVLCDTIQQDVGHDLPCKA